jgi:elongation factor Ts
MPHHIGSYLHSDQALAVLVLLKTNGDMSGRTSEFKRLAHDVAMHIAASDPLCVSTADLDPSHWARHLAVHARMLGRNTDDLDAGEVARIREAFERERLLLRQPFIKDPNVTVAHVVLETSETLQDDIQILEFTRYDVRGT